MFQKHLVTDKITKYIFYFFKIFKKEFRSKREMKINDNQPKKDILLINQKIMQNKKKINRCNNTTTSINEHKWHSCILINRLQDKLKVF
jgi:hypothetical protein